MSPPWFGSYHPSFYPARNYAPHNYRAPVVAPQIQAPRYVAPPVVQAPKTLFNNYGDKIVDHPYVQVHNDKGD